MEFNPSKCQVVQVTGSRKPINCIYRLHGHVLETVTSAKYLGVDVSSGLTWSPHIDRITGNANKTLGFLKCNIKKKQDAKDQGNSLQHLCKTTAGVRFSCVGSPYKG